MTTISVETILASRHSQRPNLTLWTMVATYPRIIHAEFMTHRKKAVNSASSRAIPIQTMIDYALNNPATPLYLGANRRGMQAGVTLKPEVFAEALEIWDESRMDAIKHARRMAPLGVHKQTVNRLLEPYTHIKVVFSTTNLGNILKLRDHPDAEPHMQHLAREIRRSALASPVQILAPGQWHLPFVTEGELASISGGEDSGVLSPGTYLEHAKTLSAARCASVSYKTVEGFDMTLERALTINGKMMTDPLHASPFEHVAQADSWDWNHPNDVWRHPQHHGPFRGFRQMRKMMIAEAVDDEDISWMEAA